MLVVQIDVDSRCRCHAVVQWSKFCYWCFVCFLSHRQIPSWSIHVHALSLATRFCRIVLLTIPSNVTVLVVMWRRGGEDGNAEAIKKYDESDFRFFHFWCQTKKILSHFICLRILSMNTTRWPNREWKLYFFETRLQNTQHHLNKHISIHCCPGVW